jgi:hypothetical protein
MLHADIAITIKANIINIKFCIELVHANSGIENNLLIKKVRM